MVKNKPTRYLNRLDLENLRYESFQFPHGKVLNIRVTSQCFQRISRIQSMLSHSPFSKSELVEMALISLEEDLLISDLSPV